MEISQRLLHSLGRRLGLDMGLVMVLRRLMISQFGMGILARLDRCLGQELEMDMLHLAERKLGVL
jgi:hypothetical protein